MVDKDRDTPPSFTEPEIVQTLTISGCEVHTMSDTVQFVGWVLVPASADLAAERRVVLRYEMANSAARQKLADLRKALAKGGH